MHATFDVRNALAPSQMSKFALVTGTSSGIGLETALLLAGNGFQVIATMRDLKKREELDRRAKLLGVDLDIRTLDVTHSQSVDGCIQDVRRLYGTIDLLVNNAGSGYLGTLEQTPETALRRMMDVNFHGVWRTTQAVMPAMRAAGSGRIITVTSIGGVVGQPFNDAYCASKFAVEGLMESLAPVARRLGIFVSLVEPGAVKSDFVETVSKSSDTVIETDGAYDSMRAEYETAVRKTYAEVAQTSVQVAATIVEAAVAEVPLFRYQTSEEIRAIVARKLVDTTGETAVAMSGARLSER